jgi:hypothetical protein
MMNRLIFLSLFYFLFSCAHDPRSKYQPFEKNNGGYVDFKVLVKDDWRKVQFYGNPYTYHSDVVALAQLRTIENCLIEKKLPRASSLYEIEKNGIIVSNTSASNYQAPSNVTLNTNSSLNEYSNNYNSQTTGQINHGMNISSSETSTQNLSRYNVKIHYKCANRAIGLGFDTVIGNVPSSIEERVNKQLSINDYLTISKVDKANKGILKVGDIITKVNGEKILDTKALVDEFIDLTDKTIALSVLRDGKEVNVVAKLVDITDKFKEVIDNFIKDKCTLLDEFKSNQLCKSNN